MTSNHAAHTAPYSHRCGHVCTLRIRDECCQCSDTRPHQDYGYLLSNLSQTRVSRSALYCLPCQTRILRNYSSPTNKQQHYLYKLLIQQHRIIQAQQKDIQAAFASAQRIAYLESIIKAKDTEIQYLQAAYLRRS